VVSMVPRNGCRRWSAVETCEWLESQWREGSCKRPGTRSKTDMATKACSLSSAVLLCSGRLLARPTTRRSHAAHSWRLVAVVLAAEASWHRGLERAKAETYQCRAALPWKRASAPDLETRQT